MKKGNLPLVLLLSAAVLAIFTAMSAYLLGHFPWVWQVSGGLGIVVTLAYFFIERKTIGSIFSKRTTQYGLNSLIMSLVVFGIVIMLNYIASLHDIKKDFTKNKLHTLSDQSVKVLRGLKQEVKLRAFVGPQQMAEFDQIIDKYTYESKLLKKDYIDVDKEPMAVEKYKIKQPGTIIVESESRSARVDNIMGPDDPKVEEKITNAIISVSKGEKKKIYFTTGHGERLTTDTGREGFSQIKEALESSRYKVEELLLADKDRIPADAEVVVVAGPKSDFMEHELKHLEGYLKIGGKVLFMVEPNATPTVKNFLASFGANWTPKKTVLETNRLQQLAGGNPLTPIVTSYSTSHEITQEAKQMTIFPIAAPVEKAQTPPAGAKVESLFSTSTKSIEVDYKERISVNEAKDRKGPISLAVAVSGKVEKQTPPKPADEAKKEDPSKKDEEAKDQEYRLVVVGDADFAANGVRGFGINSDLFQNMMSWLAKEEDLISIRPRPTDASEFEITEERFRIIYMASVWILPPLMLISGIFMWFTRRRK